MKIAVSGVTLTGNLGAAAMLQTVRQEILRRHPGAELALLSISPGRDRAAGAPPRLHIVPAHWLALILVFLPLSVLAFPFRRSRLARSLLGRIAYFRALFECTAVVDICGIAFVDGRGLGLLAYNLALCVPALVFARPVFKLAQTLGPFAQPLNRHAARWTLSRCTAVIARGEQSGHHLRALGFRDPTVRPDITFCLHMPAEAWTWAAAALRSHGFNRPPVMLSPSRVLQHTCARHGIDLVAIFAGLITRQQERGEPVALLVHSHAAGIAKHDDPAVCAEILARLPADARPPVLAAGDPVRARALIGSAALFVGCRYHALVSAYATAVPAIALSWNFKYADLAELFGQQEWLVKAEDLALDSLDARLLRLQRAATGIRAGLQQRLPAVVEAAAQNFTALERALTAAAR